MKGTTWDVSLNLENVSNCLVGFNPTHPSPPKKCYSSQIESFLQVLGDFFFVEITTY